MGGTENRARISRYAVLLLITSGVLVVQLLTARRLLWGAHLSLSILRRPLGTGLGAPSVSCEAVDTGAGGSSVSYVCAVSSGSDVTWGRLREVCHTEVAELGGFAGGDGAKGVFVFSAPEWQALRLSAYALLGVGRDASSSFPLNSTTLPWAAVASLQAPASLTRHRLLVSPSWMFEPLFSLLLTGEVVCNVADALGPPPGPGGSSSASGSSEAGPGRPAAAPGSAPSRRSLASQLSWPGGHVAGVTFTGPLLPPREARHHGAAGAASASDGRTPWWSHPLLLPDTEEAAAAAAPPSTIAAAAASFTTGWAALRIIVGSGSPPPGYAGYWAAVFGEGLRRHAASIGAVRYGVDSSSGGSGAGTFSSVALASLSLPLAQPLCQPWEGNGDDDAGRVGGGDSSSASTSGTGAGGFAGVLGARSAGVLAARLGRLFTDGIVRSLGGGGGGVVAVHLCGVGPLSSSSATSGTPPGEEGRMSRVWLTPHALESGSTSLHYQQFNRASPMVLHDRKEVLAAVPDIGPEFHTAGELYLGVDRHDARLVNRGFNPPAAHAPAGTYLTAFNVVVTAAGGLQTLHRVDPGRAWNHHFHVTCEGPEDALPRRERHDGLPLYDEVVVLTHRREWNIYHWTAEALGKAAPLVDYLRAHPHVMLHVMKLPDPSEPDKTGKYRERHLRLLGLQWRDRVVTGNVRARVVHYPDNHGCRFPYAHWAWLLRERLRAAMGHPSTHFIMGAGLDGTGEVVEEDEAAGDGEDGEGVRSSPSKKGRGSSGGSRRLRPHKARRQKAGGGSSGGGDKNGAQNAPVLSPAASQPPTSATAPSTTLVGAAAIHASRSENVSSLYESEAIEEEEDDEEGDKISRSDGRNDAEDTKADLFDGPSGGIHSVGRNSNQTAISAVSLDSPVDLPSPVAAGGWARGPSSSGKRLVVVLKRRGEREIQNEPWLMKRLAGHADLEVRVLDDKAFPDPGDVLHAFAQADAIVGAHGAGLTNNIVAKPGACVVEIMPRAWFVPCYWRMSGHLGLRHNMFVTVGDKRSALVVNVRRVVRALRACLAQQDEARTAADTIAARDARAAAKAHAGTRRRRGHATATARRARG